MTGRGKFRRPLAPRRAGFALPVVIWGVGLIGMMIVAFMTSGRLRLQAANNVAGAVVAGYVAEAAVNLTTLALLAKENSTAEQPDAEGEDGAPRFCRFDDAVLAVAVEDEGGKIDLNAAPVETLQALLLGLGVGETEAREVAGSIVAFRTAPPSMGSGAITLATPAQSDKAIPLKQAPFETTTELDQVGGVNPALYRFLLRFVTVKSHNPGLDPRTAPPGLFAALAGYPVEDVRRLAATPFPNKLNRKDPRFPSNVNQMSDRSAYLIHVDALLPTGSTATREALIDLRPSNGKPFLVKEFRRGDAIYADQLRAIFATNVAMLPNC